MSDSLDRLLRWDEWLAMRGHWLVCRVCPPVKKLMDSIARAARQTSPSPSNERMSADAKERIKRALPEKQHPT